MTLRLLKVSAAILQIELIHVINIRGAIVFQFARVGNDRDGRRFLEHLDNKSPVKDYVDTLSGGDLVGIMGMRTQDQALTEKHQWRVCDKPIPHR